MTSKPGQQTIAIQILPNISRSKEKEISQKERNILLEKIIHKMRWRNYSETLF